MCARRWIFLILLVGVGLVLVESGGLTAAIVMANGPVEGYELPFGPNPFAPSNARTTTGTFIRQEEFIPAARCAGCHTEAHSQWRESAHGNYFRELFYQANVKHFIKDRSLAVTRHCESCHNPVALFSGALSENAKFARPFDEEGVTCTVCHSIQSTTTDGIGSYVIAPPSLLEKADGTRIANASDDDIRSDIDAHRRAMMRPLLKTPEFCAACHKAAVVPELNKRKWLRSFAVYDEWQQSAFSQETTQPLGKRDRQSCQACHMPQMNGIQSHRWPGANTAVPDFYGFKDQFAATEKLLKSGILAIEIFPCASSQPSAISSQPDKEKSLGFQLSTFNSQLSTVEVDVVVANRGVGHAFRPNYATSLKPGWRFPPLMPTERKSSTVVQFGPMADWTKSPTPTAPSRLTNRASRLPNMTFGTSGRVALIATSRPAGLTWAGFRFPSRLPPHIR